MYTLYWLYFVRLCEICAKGCQYSTSSYNNNGKEYLVVVCDNKDRFESVPLAGPEAAGRIVQAVSLDPSSEEQMWWR